MSAGAASSGDKNGSAESLVDGNVQVNGCKKRKLKARNTDEQVNRMLEDHFRDWPKEVVDGRRVQGQTLREKLTDDKHRQNLGEKVVMGKNYFRQTQCDFSGPENAVNQMRPDNDDEEVPNRLLMAMRDAKLHFADRSGIISWMNDVAPLSLNSTQVAGVLKWALTLKPTSKAELPSCLAVMRWVSRCKLPAEYANQCVLMRSWYDAVLLEAWVEQKRLNVKPSQFLAMHRESVLLVIDEAKLNALSSCDDWIKSKNELHHVVESSSFGKSMFGWAVQVVLNTEIADKIHEMCKALKDQTCIDGDDMTERRNAIVEAVQGMSNFEILQDKREVKIKYRDETLLIWVRSVSEQVSLSVSAAAKSILVDAGFITKLWCEDVLCGEDAADHKPPQIEADSQLVDGVEKCRKYVNNLVATQASSCTGAVLLNFLKNKEQSFFTMDIDFKIEMAIIAEVCGPKASARLEKKILQCLPNKETCGQLQPAESAMRLNMLQQKPVYLLAPKAVQGKLSTIVRIMGALAEHREPSFAGYESDEFIQKVVSLLQWFVSAEEPSTKKQVYGSTAMLVIHEQVKAKAQQGEVINMNELNTLQTYRWLVPKDIQQSIEQITQESLEEAGIAESQPTPQQAKQTHWIHEGTAMQQAVAAFKF